MVPLHKWIANDVIFKFWADNLDHTERGVRDIHSDHHGTIVDMYSLLLRCSHTPVIELPQSGQVTPLMSIPSDFILHMVSDVQCVHQCV